MRAITGKSFIEAAERIAAWRRPLLITHTNPDGDAIGSLIAMRSFLQGQGSKTPSANPPEPWASPAPRASLKPRPRLAPGSARAARRNVGSGTRSEPTALLFDPIPNRYFLFKRYAAVPVFGREVGKADLDSADGVIILDTCAYAQLDPIADWLRAAAIPKLAVDHHKTRDDLADYYLIDDGAAATCLILNDWAKAAGWPIDRQTAEALFIGIAMDTGWFRHSNTDQRALAAAGDLIARGAIAHELFQQLYQRETPGRVRLLGAALSTLELLAGDRLAVMTLTGEAFVSVGATRPDTEDIVNEPLRIGSVTVSVLLVEHGDGLIRASFRSKPPTAATDPDVDVAALAKTFGGGGHHRAAGAKIPGSLSDVRHAVVEQVRKAMSS